MPVDCRKHRDDIRSLADIALDRHGLAAILDNRSHDGIRSLTVGGVVHRDTPALARGKP